MSNILKTKLEAVYNELQGAKTNIGTSKKSIADALRFNGITNVSDTETFERYAELIRRLKSANAMVLEFQIPESATTTYKRTIVLPMQFGLAGNNGASLNTIAKELIAMDPDTSDLYPDEEQETEQEEDYSEHLIEDVYGNIVMDGNFTIPMRDINEYLSEEEAAEFLTAAENLGYNVTENGISTMAGNEDGGFEPSTTATYSYTVDWGDGTPECIFDEKKTYADNKSAIWHTYSGAGVYDVTINGTYKRIYTQGDEQPNLVENGEYVDDSDGTHIVANNNYAMRNHLIAVIAWGNTLLSNMNSAFRKCEKLVDIPMYDTTNSFVDVTDFSYVFYRCYALKSLPFNANTNKGLFSGCEKATTFAYAFGDCTGLTEPIPVKIIDGCPNVTNVQRMFGGCTKMTGSIPVGMFAGMTNLQNASQVFENNTQMDGELSEDLFADCPNITTIYRLFYGCTKITGTLTRNFIGGLSKLTEMRQAFYNCKGIIGCSSDAFYNLKANNINCRDAFYGSGIKSIPSGLLEAMTGKNLTMERMFGNCVSLTSIPSTCLANLKVANARGMFGGCTKLTSACPEKNTDWDTYEGIQRWYGIFAKTALSDIDTVALELGGDGNRKFSDGKVGAIVLKDYTFVDPKNYVYRSSNVPMGVVYADTYINSGTSVSTIANGAGNVVASNGANAVHKIFATVLNDTNKPWTNQQNNAEDITTITNTSNVEVAYNKFTWNNDGTSATRNATRYNGEAYTKAINDWRVDKGMATYTAEAGYKKTGTDKYDAVDYVNEYSQNGVDRQKCFLPDGADLWDQFTMKYLIQKAIDKIIAGGGGYSSSNAYSMRDDTWYWASAESSSTGAWHCNTNLARVNGWYDKWGSGYVRPSFAIEA